MVRWAILLMKLVVGACVIWQTTKYASDKYPLYSSGFDFAFDLLCTSVMPIGSACLFLIALVLINEANIFRVLINWTIIAFFTIAAWGFGNFTAGKPRDHFEATENWYLCICCAMFGSLMGYTVCLMREPKVLDEDQLEDDLKENGRGYESQELVEMVHD